MPCVPSILLLLLASGAANAQDADPVGGLDPVDDCRGTPDPSQTESFGAVQQLPSFPSYATEWIDTGDLDGDGAEPPEAEKAGCDTSGGAPGWAWLVPLGRSERGAARRRQRG